jgi:hypothetical protein
VEALAIGETLEIIANIRLGAKRFDFLEFDKHVKKYQ